MALQTSVVGKKVTAMLSRRRFVQTASLGTLALFQAACAVASAQEGASVETWQPTESGRDAEAAADKPSVLEWQPAEGLYPFDDLAVADIYSALVTWDLIGSYELEANELACLVELLVALEAPVLDKGRDIHIKKAAFELEMKDGSVCSLELGTTTGEPYGYVDDGETYVMQEAAYLLINGIEHNMYVGDVAAFVEMYTAYTDKLRSGLPEFIYPFADFNVASLETIYVDRYYPAAKTELNAEQIDGLLESFACLNLASATALEPEWLMAGGYSYRLRLRFPDGKVIKIYIANQSTQLQINSLHIDIVDESCNDALDYCASLF